MREMLRIVNQMKASAVIDNYAIGGAMGALYYLEPVSTLDVDIFIPFDNAHGNPLNPLGPIFDYLRPLGFAATGEHVEIAGELVQFLPADDHLLREAVENAVEVVILEEPARIMTAEHLMAIALRLGRFKDLARLEQFVGLQAFDSSKLEEILDRHGLSQKWENFKNKL